MRDKRKAFEAILEKFEKILPHLGNENDGEALNALRSLTALLKKAGLDWHDLVTLLHGSGESFLEMLMRLMEKEADALVRLARAGATLFFSTKRVAFADVRIGNHVLTQPLRSPEFSDWLLGEFFKEFQKAPKLASERDAIRTLSAIAKFETGQRCEVYLRSARVGETLFLDVGDETGRAIEVTAAGWRVLPASPVKFQRMAGMGALPIPERGGEIEQLRRFTNLSDANFILYVSVLTDALCPGRPHVLLNLIGESGSGKTTAMRIARALTDPSDVPAGTLQREARDLFADVNGSHVLSYDNASTIPKSISDSLCQVTSGTGFRKRKLYSDLEQVLVGGYRTVILTGVYNAVTEPDLAERCITMNLPHVALGQRCSEECLWKEFERARPAIFGALLGIAAHGLKQLPRTHVPDLPRLADFALWGVAIEGAFAPAGSFLRAFTASQAAATDATVEVSPVATAIAAFMEDRTSWDGTTTQLWRELQTRDQAETRPTETKGWPRDPVSFGIALTKAIPTLRKIGIEATRDRSTSRKRTPMLHLRGIERREEPAQQQYRATGTAERSERSEGSLMSNHALANVIAFPEN
jgi:hypothetical protein